ncbi:uncharacterized protein LOC143143125 [Ptiloglossa arizonensis]|uniref:uncharacterized protein LOC143143125 n=1 Tax=Ptiloglossa arizonensis TaxID=3350558 RepID=UPI003FA0AA93
MGWMLRARVSSESSRSTRVGIGFTLGCCRPVCWCVGLLFGLSTRANRGACPNRAGEENRGTRSVVSRTPHRHHPTYQITPEWPDYPRPRNNNDGRHDRDTGSHVSWKRERRERTEPGDRWRKPYGAHVVVGTVERTSTRWI